MSVIIADIEVGSSHKTENITFLKQIIRRNLKLNLDKIVLEDVNVANNKYQGLKRLCIKRKGLI